jgi:hypothetical protein
MFKLKREFLEFVITRLFGFVDSGLPRFTLSVFPEYSSGNISIIPATRI